MSEATRIASALSALFRLGWREAAADHMTMIVRATMFAIPVLVFVAIWAATPLDLAGELAGLPRHDAAHLAWYVTITEWIVFIGGMAFVEVEEDIRSGAVEASLTRPLPYGPAVLAEWLGGGAYRLLALGAFGIALITLVTGLFPFTWAQAPFVLLSVALSAGLILCVHLGIGLLTAWVSTPRPIYWIWQKVLFVLGGLLIPLTLYPDALSAVAGATPFAAMLFHPASLVLDASPEAIARVLGWQVFWLVVMALSVRGVETMATRRFLRLGV